MDTGSEISAMIDRVVGCILGTAVGDALGMPVEMMKPEDIRLSYGRITGFLDSSSRYSHGLKRGQWTDDTRLTIANAEGLLAFLDDALEATGHVSFDTHRLGEHVLRAHHRALDDHADRGFGKSTRESLADRKAGLDPFDGRRPMRPGNGCAMKGAVWGVFYGLLITFAGTRALDDRFYTYLEREFDRLIIETSRLTHNDPRSITAAFVQAHVAKLLFLGAADLGSGRFWADLLNETRRFEKHFSGSQVTPKISDVLSGITITLLAKNEEEIAAVLKTGGTVWESFPLALAYAAKYRDNFQKAVLAGANAGGDTDTIAAMTGALIGTKLGAREIPEEWLVDLEDCDELAAFGSEIVGKTAQFAERFFTNRSVA